MKSVFAVAILKEGAQRNASFLVKVPIDTHMYASIVNCGLSGSGIEFRAVKSSTNCLSARVAVVQRAFSANAAAPGHYASLDVRRDEAARQRRDKLVANDLDIVEATAIRCYDGLTLDRQLTREFANDITTIHGVSETLPFRTNVSGGSAQESRTSHLPAQEGCFSQDVLADISEN